jgi:hypothetical protein
MPPLSLSDAERELVTTLAEPIEQRLRGDFLQALADRLATAPVVGPGTLYQAARELQRQFRDPAPDLRTGRSGSRG